MNKLKAQKPLRNGLVSLKNGAKPRQRYPKSVVFKNIETLQIESNTTIAKQKFKVLKFEPVLILMDNTSEVVDRYYECPVYMAFDYSYGIYEEILPYNVYLLNRITEKYGMSLSILDNVLFNFFAKKDYYTLNGLIYSKQKIDRMLLEYFKLMNVKHYEFCRYYALKNITVSSSYYSKQLIGYIKIDFLPFMAYGIDATKFWTVIRKLRSRNGRRAIVNWKQISRMSGVDSIFDYEQYADLSCNPLAVSLTRIDRRRTCKDYETLHRECTKHELVRDEQALSPDLYVFEVIGYSDDIVTHRGTMYAQNVKIAQEMAAQFFSFLWEKSPKNWEAYMQDIETRKTGKALGHISMRDSHFTELNTDITKLPARVVKEGTKYLVLFDA